MKMTIFPLFTLCGLWRITTTRRPHLLCSQGVFFVYYACFFLALLYVGTFYSMAGTTMVVKADTANAFCHLSQSVPLR